MTDRVSFGRVHGKLAIDNVITERRQAAHPHALRFRGRILSRMRSPVRPRSSREPASERTAHNKESSREPASERTAQLRNVREQGDPAQLNTGIPRVDKSGSAAPSEAAARSANSGRETNQVRIHPIVARQIDPELLKKMGAVAEGA